MWQRDVHFSECLVSLSRRQYTCLYLLVSPILQSLSTPRWSLHESLHVRSPPETQQETGAPKGQGPARQCLHIHTSLIIQKLHRKSFIYKCLSALARSDIAKPET